MKLKIPIKEVKGEVVKNTLLIKFKSPFKVLSSAVLNGGLKDAKAIINHRVLKKFNLNEVQKILEKVALDLNLSPESVVGLMTGADVKKVAIVSKFYKGLTVSSIVTAGISNVATAGDSLKNSSSISTINIIVLVNASLNESCLVNAIQTITEAKCMALKDLDIRSHFSKEVASGTTTDAVALATINNGKLIKYAGTATKLGELIGKSVREAVKNAIIKQEMMFPNRELIYRLEERGVKLKDLIDTAMELYLHHPSMGSRKNAKEILKKELEKALSDVNVASLIIAGLRLEEDGINGSIPGLDAKTFIKDPVFLVADEILGMAISNYIAGAKGIFEYARFDRLKPGLLKKLGPFMDDVIGGLIAGASSSMYSRILSKG
ncbi:MAG: bifunctional adenosylcobinamide hydrolase/alpha-ribazole phosphatase CbiS [Candidatus Bathyarchaeia archaeon]